jgi:hypothetical protein
MTVVLIPDLVIAMTLIVIGFFTVGVTLVVR